MSLSSLTIHIFQIFMFIHKHIVIDILLGNILASAKGSGTSLSITELPLMPHIPNTISQLSFIQVLNF